MSFTCVSWESNSMTQAAWIGVNIYSIQEKAPTDIREHFHNISSTAEKGAARVFILVRKRCLFPPTLFKNDIFSPLMTHCFFTPIVPCLPLFFPILHLFYPFTSHFHFFFPFLLFSFTFSSFISSPFHIFSPNDIGWYPPPLKCWAVRTCLKGDSWVLKRQWEDLTKWWADNGELNTLWERDNWVMRHLRAMIWIWPKKYSG